MPDLIVVGGTVVTAERSFPADVAVSDGQIQAVEAGLAVLSDLLGRATVLCDESPPFPETMATMPSTISLPTQSIATGSPESARRRTTVATARGGLVAHTMRSKGGMFRSAARRARQSEGPSFFGTGGCTISV